MDVDKKKSTTVRTQNLPKLTPQLRDELRKKGACFRCRKPGHMSCECPGPNSIPISNSSSKTTSGKGKNRREVVEEDDEEKAEESEEEEQPKKQEKKRVRKAKATPSIASSSRTPVIETDDEAPFLSICPCLYHEDARPIPLDPMLPTRRLSCR